MAINPTQSINLQAIAAGSEVATHARQLQGASGDVRALAAQAVAAQAAAANAAGEVQRTEAAEPLHDQEHHRERDKVRRRQQRDEQREKKFFVPPDEDEQQHVDIEC